MRTLRLFSVTLFAAASQVGAQGDPPRHPFLQAMPQYTSYKVGDPANRTVSELSVPVIALVPLVQRFSLDVATAYVSARLESEAGTSTLSGLTDTQLRVNYTMLDDNLALTLGLNLPTGKSTIDLEQLELAGYLGNDFLAFPVSGLGTGFAATGGFAYARPLGTWNAGVGVSFRRSSTYEPIDVGGERPRFQPGDEYRVRVGADRVLANGAFAFGLTYLSFGQERTGDFVYSTGDRLVAQLAVVTRMRAGELAIVGWSLLRGTGERADGVETPRENISNLALGYAFEAGTLRIEPALELRAWIRARDEVTGSAGGLVGQLAVPGVRVELHPFGLRTDVKVGYALGSLSLSGGESAALTGWRAALVLRR